MAAGDPGSPARYYSSTAVETALSGSIPSQSQGQANTAFIVASVSGFPASYPYTLIVDPDTSKEEVVTVTAGSGTTLTVTRGSDNTQAVAHSAGAVVRHGVSGRDFRESENHIAARGYDIDQTILDAANQTHVHGIATGDGVIVGTTKAQTLTQKTLTTPTINGATISGAVTSTATVTGGTFTAVTVTSSTISTSTFTGSFTASSATFVSPTISGSPVITGLSSVGMVNSSATPKIYVDTILGSAQAAAVSAASAAASATSAATSATSAAASASAAASSASASATSASAAATSAASAATSATAAATSATSAAASATAAATSATSAAASATTAAASVATIAGYAITASNSASAAASSANDAAASATAAATSAASAAASTSAAAVSAAAAATSATSASASATAAATSATSAATSATSSANSASASATSASASATSAAAAATSATSAATSAASAATSASSAATTYDEFDDRYLGSKSTPPTVDNDGNPLIVGAIYWNSTLNNMYVWSGSVWVQIATTSVYTAPTLGSTVIASGTTYSTITGLTLDGGLTTADPTVNLGIANKQYVDNAIAGLHWKSAANLRADSNVALTGTAGTLVIDGHAALVAADSGYRILLNGQTTASENGIYTYSDNGSTYTLARSTDADTYLELEGAAVYVLEGTLYGGTAWVQTEYTLTSFSGQVWNQFGASTTYSAGDGLTLASTTFAVSSDVLRTTGGQVISANTSSTALEIRQVGSGNAFVVEDSTNPDATPVVITTTGSVGIGTSSPVSLLHVDGGFITSQRYANGGVFRARRANGTATSPTQVLTNDVVYYSDGTGLDNTGTYRTVAGIAMYAAGDVTSTSSPGTLTLGTTSVGSTGLTERIRIDSSGNTFVNSINTSPGQNTGGLSIAGKDIELMQIMGAY